MIKILPQNGAIFVIILVEYRLGGWKMEEKQKTGAMDRLSWREKICYGSGGLGVNLMFTAMSSFLLVYYADYAGINTALVATIMAVSKFLDAVSDVAMGFVMERFARPGKKARPWLKRICIPYALAGIMMFTVPELEGMAAQGLYVFVTYNLFCTMYTMIVIPYNSLGALITRNDKEREMISVFMNVFITVASMVVTSFTMTFVQALGNTKQSWTIVLIVYGIISAVVFFLAYGNTEERTMAVGGDIDETDNLPMSEQVKMLFKNKYWALLTVNAVNTNAIIALSSGTLYFFLNWVCGVPQAISVCGMLLSVPMLFLIPASKPVVGKFGKRNSLIAGILLMIAGRLIVGFAGSSLLLIYGGSAVFALGCSTSWVGTPMLFDTIEYGEWKHGVRQDGMIVSAQSFGQKVGTALGNAICGWGLALAGYAGTASVQTDKALTGISVIYIWIPILLMAVNTVLMTFYRLDKEYPAIAEELEKRRNDHV